MALRAGITAGSAAGTIPAGKVTVDRCFLFYPVYLLTRTTVVEPYAKDTSTLNISLQKVSVPSNHQWFGVGAGYHRHKTAFVEEPSATSHSQESQ
jgi:hypothetical protein